MNKTTINKELFSKRLTQLMQENNETTYTMGDRFGLSSPTISRYMTGQMAAKITTIKAFAEYFSVNELWLMGYDVPRKKDKRLIIDNDTTIILEPSKKNLLQYKELFDTIFKGLGEMIIEQPNGNKKYISEYIDYLSTDEKITLLKSLIDVIKYDTKENALTICYNFTLTDEQELYKDYNELNDIGKKEAKKRIHELTFLDEYRKKKEGI